MAMEKMSKFTNPLSKFTKQTWETYLYCLADGKQMPEEVKHDMLNISILGREWKDEFLQECFKDITRFDKPIKRRNLKSFASVAIKSRVKCKNEKIVELKTTRDLMGKLLYLACTRKIELKEVFCFPLTSSPLFSQYIWQYKEDTKVQALQIP